MSSGQGNEKTVTSNNTAYTYNYSGKKKVYHDGRGRTAHRAMVRFVKLLDVIMVSIPFILAWILYFSHKVYIVDFYRKGNWLVIALFVIIYYLLSPLYQGYTLNVSRISELVYAQTLGALITDGIMFIVMWLVIRHVPNLLVLLAVFVAQFALVILWSKVAHDWYFRNHPPIPTAVVYDELEGVEKLISYYGLDCHFKIVKRISIHELHGKDWYSLPRSERHKREVEYVHQVLDDVDAVFLCALHSHDRNQFVKYCVHKDITSWCIPRIGDVIMSGAEKSHLFHLPMLRVGRYNPTPEYLLQKRAFDIVVSGLALIVFSPLMIILALIIRMDGGTAFYRQKRLTKDGKVFEILNIFEKAA